MKKLLTYIRNVMSAVVGVIFITTKRTPAFAVVRVRR